MGSLDVLIRRLRLFLLDAIVNRLCGEFSISSYDTPLQYLLVQRIVNQKHECSRCMWIAWARTLRNGTFLQENANLFHEQFISYKKEVVSITICSLTYCEITKANFPRSNSALSYNTLFTRSRIFNAVTLAEMNIILTMGCKSSENWKSRKVTKSEIAQCGEEPRELFLVEIFVRTRRPRPSLSLPLPARKKPARFRSAKQRTRDGNFIRSALRTGTDLRPNPSSTSYCRE